MSATISLRAWQYAFARALAEHAGDDFLLVACPAAGKTIAAGAAVAQVMAQRGCDQLVVVCPTVVVRDQWASELRRLGFCMRTGFPRGGWPASDHGACVTYAQVAQRADRYAAACRVRATAVICDEVHHVGRQLAWGEALREAFTAARMRLLLSGTPFRSDGAQIPWVPYGPDAMCRPDFTYDYRQAVSDGVCRPVEFFAHDGVITWAHDGQPRTASFTERVEPAERARRLRAALDPRQPYIAAMLADAHADLLALREQVPDTAGLVVCDSQAHALEIDRLLTEITGTVPVLASSDIPRAHRAIAAFAGEDGEWLVSVRMVSEGVDIPRLGVIAWATAARTELLVRQVAGRAVRIHGEHASLAARVHIPADSQLAAHAARLHVLGGVSLRARDDEPAGARTQGREAGGSRAPQALDAQPTRDPARAISPPLPPSSPHATPDRTEIIPPALPPSPEDIAAAAQARDAMRAELLRLLSVYSQLRRSVDPAYQLASARAELATAVGIPGPDACADELHAALEWVRNETASLAVRHPEQLVTLARTRRRLAAA